MNSDYYNIKTNKQVRMEQRGRCNVDLYPYKSLHPDNQTLEKMKELSFNFEKIVVHNNKWDAGVWKQLQEVCGKLAIIRHENNKIRKRNEVLTKQVKDMQGDLEEYDIEDYYRRLPSHLQLEYQSLTREEQLKRVREAEK